MEIDILGKVKEKRLAYSHTLLPLFEAVVNSIHAIEEGSSTKPGIIRIELIRDNQQSLGLNETDVLPTIIDFVIRDNGIGFNDKNYESFNYAHSTYKLNRGGKGIGRFTWLRAFHRAEIESFYKDGDKTILRKFNFEPTKKGIEKYHKEEVSDPQERYTEVRLKNLKDDYRKWCNSKGEDIAIRILEHCFVYFLDKDCPRIIIKDGNEEVIVNDRFNLFTKGAVKRKSIEIRNNKFNVDLVKLFSPRIDNKIHYCANTREVFNEKISGSIPEFDRFIEDPNGEKFSIAAYVSGDYLDSKVNEERTEISFPKEQNEMFPDEITLEEIREKVIKIIADEFSTFLESLSEDRLNRVKKFVQDHPRYRHLLKYKKEDIRQISSTLSNDKLEIELFKVQQKLEYEVISEAKSIMNTIDKLSDKDEFKTVNNELYNKIIEVGNSKLSEYILHRKLVLDLLEKHLKKSDEGKYMKEDAIHKLIFPLKSYSDDIGFDDHNLWVIDERLSFHKYLASDKPLKKVKEIKSPSDSRPDLIIFNKPFAFNESEKPFSSIVLVEFKRPMRDDYNDDENPINQISKYTREILSSKGVDKDGRPLDLREGTPIYAYVICDLTTNLRQMAEDQGYIKFPDNNGYFFFNPNHGLYVEIISFDKLIKDSKQRNKVLFEKLNLPTI